MPQGVGTYGSQVGRPPKKTKQMYSIKGVKSDKKKTRTGRGEKRDWYPERDSNTPQTPAGASQGAMAKIFKMARKKKMKAGLGKVRQSVASQIRQSKPPKMTIRK